MASDYFFDAWPGSDAKGAPLGELSEAYNRQFRDEFNGLGNGSFTINRHDDQATWCATDNLIRVRLEPGGPFAWDDPRYVFAFWIEEGADVTVSTDEEGGEEYTREGRGIMAYLERAIVYNKAFSTGTGAVNPGAGYWSWAEGVHSGAIMNRLMNEVKARFAAGADTWYAIEDFGDTHDSDGDIWPELDEKYQVTIGTDYLSVIGLLQDLGQQYGMDPDFALHGWNDHSRDLTGTIEFEKGVNIREAAERQIHASPAKSRALVRGATKSGSIIYREIASPGTEAAIGRREGYVEYTRTASSTILGKAGVQYLRKLKLHHDGPQTIGVTIGDGTEFASGHYVPFTDYRPGDFVKVHIPGEYSHATVKVNAIVGSESDSGQPEIALEFEETPFTESPGPAQIGGPSDVGPGGGSNPGGCGDCPPQTEPPFVPETTEPDVTLDGCNTIVEDGNRDINPFPTGGSVAAGQTWYYEARNTQHNPAAQSQTHGWSLGINNGFTTTVAVDLDAIVVASNYQPTYPFPILPLIAGTFVAPDTGIWLMTGGAGYAVAPGVPPSDECWQIKLWKGGKPASITQPQTNQPIGSGEIVALVNTDDGVTTQAQTNYPYTPTSLRVAIRPTDPTTSDYGALQEVIPVETDPANGLFSLNFLLPEGWEVVIREYQASSRTHTSTDNAAPTPSTFALFPSDVVEEQREFGLAADVGLSFAYARGDATGGTPDDPAASTVLDDLADVVAAAPTEGDILRYDGAEWVNYNGHYEPVVADFGFGPEIVFDSGDIVMEWFA